MLSRSVDRYAADRVDPRADALERGLCPGVLDELVAGLRDLGLFDIDLLGPGGSALYAAALGALAERSPALAVLVLSDAVARAHAGEPGPAPGLGAFPLYAEVVEPASALVIEERGGRTLLSGRVELVVGAPVASFLTLPVRGGGHAVIPARAPGILCGAQVETLGMHGCPVSDVVADAVEISPAARSCAGRAARVAARARGPAASIAAGILAASLRDAVAHARARIQGGRPIVEHPQVRAMLSEMLADLTVARAAVDALSLDEPPPLPAALGLFVRARDAAARGARDGVQLLGGTGYMEDQPQARRMRDARQASLLLGRADLLRQDAVASLLSA
jgi:alkylation response protein AidB-like acyl-CoA dehydrogenase